MVGSNSTCEGHRNNWVEWEMKSRYRMTMAADAFGLEKLPESFGSRNLDKPIPLESGTITPANK